MASICMPTQTGYQQFQLTNGNIMLLPGAHSQQQQQQQQQQHLQQQTQQQFFGQHQLAHIAPKTPLGNSQLQNIQTSAASGLGAILQKKKYTYTNIPYGEQIPSVARRNARERNRVKQVNNGFVNLRQHIPQTVINALSHGGRGASKKLSKVDTLRIAVEYIRGLQDLLEDGTQPQHQIHHLFHSDESSNDGSSAYSFMGSPDSSTTTTSPQQQKQQQQQQHQQQQQQQIQPMHSYHSEQSTSPTPSYSDSDVSYMQQRIKLEANAQHQQQHHQQQQQQSQSQFKFEPFDSFSDDQGDDEELLDYISSWQEQ